MGCPGRWILPEATETNTRSQLWPPQSLVRWALVPAGILVSLDSVAKVARRGHFVNMQYALGRLLPSPSILEAEPSKAAPHPCGKLARVPEEGTMLVDWVEGRDTWTNACGRLVDLFEQD
jgi:hypothetical protein